MIELKKKLNMIIDFIIDKNDVILVDFPMYYNIGDHLIFLGELQFFQENNINLKFALSTVNTNMPFLKKHITKNTTIICQGGGNFGDIYPVHQNLREDIIKNFPKNRIIVLPQTAFFENDDLKKASQKVFNQHSDVILFARDEASLNIFKNFSNHAYLMPDMAHALYGTLNKAKTIQKKKLYFLRKDIEKHDSQLLIENKIDYKDILDWSDLIQTNDRIYLKGIYLLTKFNNKAKLPFLQKLIFKLWVKKSKSLTKKFSHLFSSYQQITTSRLHGHILSCLVDTPSIVLDNSYGKNTGYYKLWTSNLNIETKIKD